MKKKPVDAKDRTVKPAREFAAMVKQLPTEERLRVEGIVLGLGMAQQTSAGRDAQDTSPSAGG